MSRSRKIFLGVLSVLPLILFAVYMIIILNFVLQVFPYQRVDPYPEEFPFQVIPIIIFAILMALASFGMLIYYIIHAVNNKKIDSTERIVWILVFLFGGMIGFPIYWYMRIWKENDLPPNPQPL